jgi:hypothetical protein
VGGIVFESHLDYPSILRDFDYVPEALYATVDIYIYIEREREREGERERERESFTYRDCTAPLNGISTE